LDFDSEEKIFLDQTVDEPEEREREMTTKYWHLTLRLFKLQPGRKCFKIESFNKVFYHLNI